MATNIRLPRLSLGWRDQPQLFERYWDEAMSTIESNLNAILNIPAIQAALTTVAATATTANATATAANATATALSTRTTALEALNATRTIALAAPGTVLTGTTSETTLATITIPAGVLGPNGQLQVDALFSYTASTNTKTPRIKFGGTAFYAPAIAVGSQVGVGVSLRIANRASVSSQVGISPAVLAGVGVATAGPVTASVNTAASVTLLITGQLALGTESITLESYSVRSTYSA